LPFDNPSRSRFMHTPRRFMLKQASCAILLKNERKKAP
jgi:hypothetical protein